MQNFPFVFVAVNWKGAFIMCILSNFFTQQNAGPAQPAPATIKDLMEIYTNENFVLVHIRCFRKDLTKIVNLGIKTLRITRKHVADEKMIRPQINT